LTDLIFLIFAGIDDVDYGLYPSKDFQLKWLRSYLTAWHALNFTEKSDLEEEIFLLYKQVNKFALVSFNLKTRCTAFQ